MARYRIETPAAPGVSHGPSPEGDSGGSGLVFWPQVPVGTFQDTGLLDRDGNKILRGPDQIGLLRDVDFFPR
jgi:hypothetical protein